MRAYRRLVFLAERPVHPWPGSKKGLSMSNVDVKTRMGITKETKNCIDKCLLEQLPVILRRNCHDNLGDRNDTFAFDVHRVVVAA
jgi:hypothetical protein